MAKIQWITLSFQLTMPNKGSWNGKWTGEDNKYYLIKKVPYSHLSSKSCFEYLLKNNHDSFYYSWGDGWGANVIVEIVDKKEADKRQKLSRGFYGYDWMVKSIIDIGEIQQPIHKS